MKAEKMKEKFYYKNVWLVLYKTISGETSISYITMTLIAKEFHTKMTLNAKHEELSKKCCALLLLDSAPKRGCTNFLPSVIIKFLSKVSLAKHFRIN